MKKFSDFEKHLKKHWIKYLVGIVCLTVILFILPYDKIIQIIKDVNNVDNVRKFISRYGKNSIIVFILLQIVQVVIFIIPGEVIQIAGGYLFSTFAGTIYSLIGITIGSCIDYYIAHSLGRVFVHKIMSKEKAEYYENTFKSKHYKAIIFLLYLIPGIPKDILAYVVGITSIPFRDFLIYSTIARLPALIVSSYFGAQIIQKNVTGIVVVSIIVAIIVVACIIFRKQIIKKIEGFNKHEI